MRFYSAYFFIFSTLYSWGKEYENYYYYCFHSNDCRRISVVAYRFIRFQPCSLYLWSRRIGIGCKNYLFFGRYFSTLVNLLLDNVSSFQKNRLTKKEKDFLLKPFFFFKPILNFYHSKKDKPFCLSFFIDR